MLKFTKEVYDKVMDEPLYRNSLYVMISTLIMSAFGFVFWLVAARLFSTEQIGLATTIISVMGLITGISVLGLNIGIIRYLPTAKDKEARNHKINTSITIVILSTIIVASIYLMGINYFSPSLQFIQETLTLSFIFIFFTIFSALSGIVESIFIALRDTKWILVKNTLFSSLKIGLLFLAVSFGAFGIYSSWMISLITALFIVFLALVYKFNYSFKFEIRDSIIKKMGKYSFGNYIAGFIGGLATLVLPIMITNMMGAETTAHYYIAMMIATLLFTIPSATSNSLFAEGAHNPELIKKKIKKSIKIISLILIPGILITLFFGNYILLAFGKTYSSEASTFLQILAISGIFVSINGVLGTLLRINNQLKLILLRSILSPIIVLGLSYLFITQGLGLLGIAYAWMIGQFVLCFVYWKKKQ